MDINKYSDWTKNTCARLPNDWIINLDKNFLNNIHMLLGISTEVGELEDVFKKHLAYGAEIDWVNIKEEVGDIMFYIASFCRINNLDFNKIIETNIKKLESRYPNQFSKESAMSRNLEAERKILEK